jgi:TonB family protein
LFLKKETFFQWNRFYLIGTFILSIVLPWIKIEAFKTTVSQEFVGYPMLFWQLEGIAVIPVAEETSWFASLPTEYIVFSIGALLSALWFGYKLFQIYWLKEKGTIRHYKDFTKVVVKKSELAFSFFKNIFLGEQIKKENEANIVAHELVHIKQWHSLDLLFFEIMRIVFWFNPLVYVYQKRVSELHEFIADSIVAKTNKKEQYQLLLAEAFQTQNISFVNQFFKKSLIKKRIIMLSKTKSKKVYQFKYLLLVPLVLGMLVYTSCEQELKEAENFENSESSSDDAALIAKIQSEYNTLKNTKEFFEEHSKLMSMNNDDNIILSKEDFFRNQLFFRNMFSEAGAESVLNEKKMEELFEIFPLPSTANYNAYAERKKVFQILDDNLKLSINSRKFIIRRIAKKDKNLGSGEFIKISNVKDLTGEEIRKVNQTLEHIKGTERFLFLSDDNHSFLISNSKNPTQTITTNQETEVLNASISVPFAVIEEVPIFPGCENASDKKECFQEKMREHIRKNFKYPKEAQELGAQGRVSLVFTISTDGSIKNIRKRGPHELLENEAVRIIERLPKMQAGKQRGEMVDVPFSIPITFRLQNDEINEIKLDIASSMLDVIESSKEYDLLPMNVGLDNTKIHKTTERYNQLAVERRRLLETTSEENPIVKNLDEQLRVLKLKIREELNNEVDKINN